MASVLGLIRRRGERVWFRHTNRSVNESSGEAIYNYSENQSVYMLMSMWYTNEDGRQVPIPAGKAVGWGRPSDFWTDAIKITVNDEIIRNPDNYSAGSADIFRVEEVKRQYLFNQSQWYVRTDLRLTKARE